jgi:PII-like signaling protein
VRHDQPIIITIIDTAENVARLVPLVEDMMHTGIIASSDVRCIRVEKRGPSTEVGGP